MADPKHPRHYEESFKRQIVQLYENGIFDTVRLN